MCHQRHSATRYTVSTTVFVTFRLVTNCACTVTLVIVN
jgi:hypothetical protein